MLFTYKEIRGSSELSNTQAVGDVVSGTPNLYSQGGQEDRFLVDLVGEQEKRKRRINLQMKKRESESALLTTCLWIC